MKYIYVQPKDYGSNSFIVYNEKTMQGFVIDCGTSGEEILQIAKDMNLNLVAQIFTHGHFDHCTDAPMLCKAGLKTYIHPKDAYLLKDTSTAQKFGYPFQPFTADFFFEEGDFELCGIKMQIIHTPGHTQGSCCIVIDDIMFSGDTLFKDGIGRTDLEGGSGFDLRNSIRKLFKIQKDYVLLPGHQDFSTLFEEKNHL